MSNIIKEAAEAGIVLYVNEGRLEYHQLSDDFPQALKEKISNNKFEIINYLKSTISSEVSSDSILAQLEQTIRATPEKVALIEGDNELTYRQFGEAIDTVARYIKANADDKPVSFLLERSTNSMVAIYAAIKANIPYVPIDNANPESRIKYFLNDTDSQLLIVSENTLTTHASLCNKVTTLEKIYSEQDDFTDLDTNVSELDPNSPAYIIYTSGSTGNPKGVVCSNGNLNHTSQFMKQQFETLGLDSSAKWLWNASYAFDASLKGVVALAQGLTVVVPSEYDVKNPKSLCSLIKDKTIPVVNAPPIVMEYLLPHLITENIDVNVIVSGDVVTQGLWEKLREYTRMNGKKVLNAYGPTEGSVNASYAIQSDNSTVSIGKCVVGAELFVLNESGESVSVGEEGELYIGGTGVALGYLNNDEATLTNFVSIPQCKGRVFKTGDLVKLRDNDELEFISRVDNQVKYRGFRIELDEIKVLISSMKEVENAVVISHGTGIEMKIEAFVVSQKGDLLTNEILECLTLNLPEYMHPNKINFIDSIPLTSGGKVDRNRLLESKSSSHDVDSSNDESVESRLTLLWKNILSLDEVNLDDNFFKLGGHSLLAMQLLQKIDEEFGVVIEIRQLFSLLTLGSQVEYVEQHSENEIDGLIDGCLVENELRRIWLDCLDIESFDVNDNFFKLGGHSLVAMKLLADIKEAFGLEMNIRWLFTHLEFERQVDWINEFVSSEDLSENVTLTDKLELEI